MKQAVATIEEPSGRIRYALLPVIIYNVNMDDNPLYNALMTVVRDMASIVAGDGTVIDLEWMEGEEENEK